MTSRRMPRALGLAAGAAALAAVPYLGYAARTYLRYGRGEHGGGDPLLDRYMPEYEVAEAHRVRVAAPARTTFAAAREVSLQGSPVSRAVFAVRTLPARLRGDAAEERGRPRGLLEETLALGWGILAEVPDREVVLGAVTKPWEPVVRFRAVPPAEFAGFREPGYAKIVWTIAAEPAGEAESVARTETRVSTTDPASRERFRRYWSLVSPGVLLIRREILRQVKADAERRHAGVDEHAELAALG